MYQTGCSSHSRDASYINSLPSSAIAFPERMLKRTQISKKETYFTVAN